MALGQKVCTLIGQFIIANSFFLVILSVIGFFGLQFYNRFYRINRDTDHIDLMKMYVDLEMRRRYRR